MARIRKAESDFSLDLTNNGEAVFEISGTTEAGQQLSIIEKKADGGTGILSYVWQSSSDDSAKSNIN